MSRLTFFDLFGYIGPFGPIPNFFGRTNHTNLTRRIDPRHPEPPNSPIPPKVAFSFFRFLGFGPEGVHFPSFRGGRGSVFWDSGEGPLALSGESWLQGVGHFPAAGPRWVPRRAAVMPASPILGGTRNSDTRPPRPPRQQLQTSVQTEKEMEDPDCRMEMGTGIL